NAAVRTAGVPPAAGTVAMKRFVNMYDALALDVSNAGRVASGDHTGCESGPFCVTTSRTAPVATVTMAMSAVPPLAGSLLMRWSKAMALPSGDQSKLPTANGPVV